MKKIIILLLGVLFVSQQANAQTTAQHTAQSVQIYTKPKLVVGIVVDQMRYDYLPRFWERYGNKGFKRLIAGGYLLKNTHYNYVPTYTAPGHTSVYTGTSPRFHGIISNTWYDKFSKEYVYCVADSTVKSVGTTAEGAKRSPHRLLSTTIADQNRLATEFRGKTIGVALKDRAAILPAGRSANAAYWFRGEEEGDFVTSTYYMDELPQWVKTFNASGKAESYLKPWTTLYPISTYKESGKDLNNYEGGFEGKPHSTFPYNLKKLSPKNGGYSILKSVPFGNALTTDFALAAIEGENLGQDNTTDFLTISYSATDYVGHIFGVNSKEVEDTYLRLDQQIARLLEALDKKVGKGNYTVFLTADHAGVEVPAYLKAKKISAGYFDDDKMFKHLKNYIDEHYGVTGLIANMSNKQIFFDYAKLQQHNINRTDFANAIKHFLVNYPQVAQAYTRQMIASATYTGMIGKRIKNGFNPKRSGDVVFVLQPAVISYSHTGSTHGSPYTYDTHVPLIFYGKGINHGQSTTPASTIDIAPTLSALLGINAPNAATGRVLSEVID